MTELQAFIAETFKGLVSDDFMEATSHSGHCRCDLCLKWWVDMGPDYDLDGELDFGPFTREEYLAAGGTIPDAETE